MDKSSYSIPPSTARVSTVTRTSGTREAEFRRRSTIVAQDKVETATQGEDYSTELASSAPRLEPGIPSSNNSLVELAEVYAMIFKSAGKQTIEQSNVLENEQSTSQTLASATITATNTMISKEKATFVKQQQALKTELKQQQTNNIASKVLLGVAAALLIVTIASSVLTGGASDAALPEEIEMVEMGGSMDGEEVAGEDDAVEEVPEEQTNVNSTTETDESGSEEEIETNQAQRQSNIENTESSSQDSSIKDKILDFLKNKGMRIATSGVGIGTAITPQILNTIASFKVAAIKHALAKDQKQLGKVNGTLEEMKMYTSWFQQELGLTTNNLTEMGGELENLLSGASDSIGAFQQIIASSAA